MSQTAARGRRRRVARRSRITNSQQQPLTTQAQIVETSNATSTTDDALIEDEDDLSTATKIIVNCNCDENNKKHGGKKDKCYGGSYGNYAYPLRNSGCCPVYDSLGYPYVPLNCLTGYYGGAYGPCGPYGGAYGGSYGPCGPCGPPCGPFSLGYGGIPFGPAGGPLVPTHPYYPF